MTVCLIVTDEITAVTFYRGYLSFLKSKGWTVHIIASPRGGLSEFGESEGVTAHALPMRRDPSPFRDLVSLGRTVALLARLRPEVVIAATPKAGLLGTLAAWVTGVPVRVYQIWGLRLETERGRRKWLFLQLERLASRLATQVVANSPSLAEEILDYRIARNVTVLGRGSSHGVDVERFDRSSSDIGLLDSETSEFLNDHPGRTTIGFIGRVNNDKGVPALIEAATECATRGLEANLLIAGPVEDNELESQLRAMAVPGLHVHRVHAVTDPRPYFLAMDMFCLPTLREGFPNVVLEAAALEVPTITTRATGARDSVIHEYTGLLVDPKNPRQLADAILRLASSSSLRKELAQNARTRALTEFSSDVMFEMQETNVAAHRLQRLHPAARSTAN